MTSPTLTAPFKNTEELSKGGRKFTYVPTPEVIERLNACLGYGGWSFEVSEAFHHPQEDPTYVVAKGRLSVLGAVYEQYGGQSVNKYGSSSANKGLPVDLADDYKGAASDALKKCAAFIGVGLYLSLKRGPTPNENAGEAQDGNDPAPARPIPSGGADAVSPPRKDSVSPAAGESDVPPRTSGEEATEPVSSVVSDPLDRVQGIQGVNKRVKALNAEKKKMWMERKPAPGPTFVAEALTVLDELDRVAV